MSKPNGLKKPKTILVAGGAGFVGSHLCDALLTRGDRVISIDNYLTGSEANIRPLRNNPSIRSTTSLAPPRHRSIRRTPSTR